MIILVTGFVSVFGEATFDGRIQSEWCDADIQISCVNKQKTTRTQHFKAVYPRDEELLVGFLTWLKCRDRSPTTTLTNLRWELKDSSDELNKVKEHITGCIPPNIASEKFLLQFAKSVRLQGNERYEEGKYERAINVYHSALLSLSEWERLVTKGDEWSESSLDCYSNILQTYIQLNQHMEARPILSLCVRLVLSATKVRPQKRAKCLYRCALIAEACGMFPTAGVLGKLATWFHANEDINLLNRRLGLRQPIELGHTIDPTPIWTNEQDKCLLCLDDFSIGKLRQLSCTHRFHKDCIVPWLEGHNTCPTCRARCTDEGIIT